LAVSGIAILLMVFHHFFGFDDFRNPQNYYIESFSIHGISFERMLAAFGKICVSTFSFLSGYALYKMADNYRTYPKVLLRLGRFLIDYWIVMALFLLYAVIIGDELPDIHNFMLNLAGLATLPVSTYVNVAFAWYVAFYILWLLLGSAHGHCGPTSQRHSAPMPAGSLYNGCQYPSARRLLTDTIHLYIGLRGCNRLQIACFRPPFGQICRHPLPGGNPRHDRHTDYAAIRDSGESGSHICGRGHNHPAVYIFQHPVHTPA